MIFAEALRRKLYFVFQDTLEEWKLGVTAGAQIPSFVPDFVFPQYKVILDPFGDYHHTLPDSVERDMRKAEEYAVLGYHFYHPWASEVEKYGAARLFNFIPEFQISPPPIQLPASEFPYLVQGYRLGPYVGIGTTSVAAANRKRKKTRTPVLRR
jgi:very-short-patch-repair endonuclease